MSDDDRMVYRRPDGIWVNKKTGNERATSTHETQKDAYDAARENMRNSGGGDISIKRGDNGQIRAKHTIPPANDPRDIPG